MQSKPAKERFIDLAAETLDGDPAKGREDCQAGWHELVAGWRFASVLDVGAGLGESKRRIPNCTTQDPYPAAPVDTHAPVGELPAAAAQLVTAFDVIEHVVEDVDFLGQLYRVASTAVFVTTPNWEVSRAANGCHVREYTPYEFLGLARFLKWQTGGARFSCLWYVGAGDGGGCRLITARDFVTHTEPHQAVLIVKA